MIIDIADDGTVSFETKGFVGNECKKVIEGFNAAFGGKVISTKATPEARKRVRAGVKTKS